MFRRRQFEKAHSLISKGTRTDGKGPVPAETTQKPRYFGLLTNDIVYDRLAPGVLEELKKVNPKDELTGRSKHKNFRWLTSNIGYPKLREHLGAVIATMKLSADWYDFKAKLDKYYPRQGKPTQLSMDFAGDEPETGKGCKDARLPTEAAYCAQNVTMQPPITMSAPPTKAGSGGTVLKKPKLTICQTMNSVAM